MPVILCSLPGLQQQSVLLTPHNPTQPHTIYITTTPCASSGDVVERHNDHS